MATSTASTSSTASVSSGRPRVNVSRIVDYLGLTETRFTGIISEYDQLLADQEALIRQGETELHRQNLEFAKLEAENQTLIEILNTERRRFHDCELKLEKSKSVLRETREKTAQEVAGKERCSADYVRYQQEFALEEKKTRAELAEVSAKLEACKKIRAERTGGR